MKKTLLFALLALAIPASAASIAWKLNTMATSNYMVGSDGNKLTGTAYLVFTTDLPGEGEKFASEAAIIEKAIGGSEGGIAIADGVNTELKVSTDNRLTAPEKYSFTAIIYDSANKAYFISSAAKEQTAYNLTGDEYVDEKSISFNAQQLYATSALRGTQTYHSVPEPSVAIMGLLGLGMLLKRRKA